MSKLKGFIDTSCAFIEYGVRGWLTYSFIVITMSTLYFLGMISEDTFALVSLIGLGLLTALWSRDQAQGYVPAWWLKLGRGKIGIKAKLI